MNFNEIKQKWRGKQDWKKGLIVGVVISVVLSIVGGFLMTGIPSIIEGTLICPDLRGSGDCGAIISFILMSLTWAIWIFMAIIVPFTILGLIIGFMISKLKKGR